MTRVNHGGIERRGLGVRGVPCHCQRNTKNVSAFTIILFHGLHDLCANPHPALLESLLQHVPTEARREFSHLGLWRLRDILFFFPRSVARRDDSFPSVDPGRAGSHGSYPLFVFAFSTFEALCDAQLAMPLHRSFALRRLADVPTAPRLADKRPPRRPTSPPAPAHRRLHPASASQQSIPGRRSAERPHGNPPLSAIPSDAFPRPRNM
ncbi:hypothetical protein FB451DRAFT_1483241, partial [Mycena latifolia]